MSQTTSDRMECMEVWGGNQATDRNFQTPGLNIWIYSRPYGQATGGGDVYYLSSCASGRITRMLLADVSGHGETVSRVAMGLRDLMRKNINFIKQTRFIRAMNQQFTESCHEDGFATALVSTFFAPTKTFTLCNAGHPAPFVYRRSTSDWTEMTSDAEPSERLSDTPLGVVDEASYCQLATRLQPGDMVLSFSDALTESLDASGRPLGVQGISELIRELDISEPETMIPTLVERITALSAHNLNQDDATLLLCQATGGGPSLKKNLLAPFRFFRPVVDRTQLTEADLTE